MNADGSGVSLERLPEQGGPLERIGVLRFPFVIGRAESCDYVVYSNKISNHHAAIVDAEGLPAIKDLGSTNGTFLNGHRVSEQRLQDGDIIQLAHVELRFRAGVGPRDDRAAAGTDASIERTHVALVNPSDSVMRGTQLLQDMIAREAVSVVFQPIVELAAKQTVGYEALGRGALPGMDERPTELLTLAEQCDLAVPLSRLFRKVSIQAASRLPAGAKLFLNVHPSELIDDRFGECLADLRDGVRGPDRPIVLEISESSIADAAHLSAVRDVLGHLQMEFAYDDFGAGQARLVELVDVPPQYVKFDRGLIRDVDQVPARQNVLRALVTVARRLGIRTVVEGVETAAVAACCQQLGCDLGQGFFFGRPR